MFRNPFHTRHNSEENSFNTRILRIFTWTFFLLTLYFIVSGYFTTINHAKNLSLRQLQGVVRSIASRIDGDAHQRLASAYLKKDEIVDTQVDGDYLKIHNLLKEAVVSNEINTPIYTFVKSKKVPNLMEFIATSSEDPYFRHEYSSFPSKSIDQLDVGGNHGLYKDEYGHWLSAFAPIKNSQGEVVAYVQADEKFDSFILSVRKEVLRKVMTSLVGFLCAILFLLPYLKQLLSKEEEQKRLLKNSLKETKLLSKELEKKEQDLKEYAYKLVQSNRDLTDFAHIASHDLKAPIRNINSFAQLILRKNKDKFDDVTIENFNFILKNSSRAQDLITGLLNYSTADKDIGKPVEFCVEDAIKIAEQNLATVITEKKVKINCSELPFIAANPTLISQVIQNLISNGIKYNQSDIPEIMIGSGEDNNRGTFFFVQDNGIGIPEKFQSDIFKMFKRLHGQAEYEGSGIGLAFCNRVVKTYGGEMWLESSEGNGARFYFTLPKATILNSVEA